MFFSFHSKGIPVVVVVVVVAITHPVKAKSAKVKSC
jgi:hypothetical protein